MIRDVGDVTIDFSKVELVGMIGGDPAWLRYKVQFTSGITHEIYEERVEGFPRAEFVKLWKESQRS